MDMTYVCDFPLTPVFAGSDRTFGVASLEPKKSVRVAREVTDASKTETLTVSHSDINGGRRRTLVKSEKKYTDSAEVARSISVSVVIDRHLPTVASADLNQTIGNAIYSLLDTTDFTSLVLNGEV